MPPLPKFVALWRSDSLQMMDQVDEEDAPAGMANQPCRRQRGSVAAAGGGAHGLAAHRAQTRESARDPSDPPEAAGGSAQRGEAGALS